MVHWLGSVASFGEGTDLESESSCYLNLGTYKFCEFGKDVYSSEY